MATSPSDLTGLFKEVYGDEIINLITDSAKNTKLIDFVSSEQQTGNKYHQPVIVQHEHGVTYAGPAAGAFALEDAITMKMQDAQIEGSQMVLRSALSYSAAARASKEGAKSFKKATVLQVQNMLESITKRAEISILHGQMGIGNIAIGGFDETGASATTATFVVSDATFADGIWAGSTGAKLVFYSDKSDTIGASTNLNANGDTNQDIIITAVNIATRTITVSGSAAAIEDINDVSATKALDIYFKTAVEGTGLTFAYNEMAGMHKIMVNTGILFNINAAVYDLWKGNTATVSGQLTFGKVLSENSAPVARGGLDEEVVLEVHPKTWENLNSDLAALRMFDGSYSKDNAEIGSQEITYYGQSGKIRIIAFNLVKRGQAFLFPPSRCKRVGAQEISFKTPGKEDEIFLQLPNNAGFEMRCYTDQALLIETPAKCLYLSGFTNA